MTQVYNWARDILLILVALSFIQILIPQSSLTRYVRFIYSLTVLAAILDPMVRLAEKLGISA